MGCSRPMVAHQMSGAQDLIPEFRLNICTDPFPGLGHFLLHEYEVEGSQLDLDTLALTARGLGSFVHVSSPIRFPSYNSVTMICLAIFFFHFSV